MSELGADAKIKKERSPSFPFIPLEKAVWRAGALLEAHKREPARLASVATTWGYAPKSSGLQQTVAALKQYGLVEDTGSGEDRKIGVTELARRILVDQRPGAKEGAIKEAAIMPRLIGEYIQRWVPDRPSDAHCVSELELDRGFNAEGAKLFLRVFDETVAFANLGSSDSLSESQLNEAGLGDPVRDALAYETTKSGKADPFGLLRSLAPKPLAQRLKIELNGNVMNVSASLNNAVEVDKLIRMLEANKEILAEADLDISGDLKQ
ncbi:MAG: hypothetical protein WBQ17_09850 [Rhizomicrobium sp.]